jgi:hypothetical protein
MRLLGEVCLIEFLYSMTTRWFYTASCVEGSLAQTSFFMLIGLTNLEHGVLVYQ